MNNDSRKRAFRLALVPLACAAALSACAPYEPWAEGGYGSTAPIESASVFDRYDTNRDGFLSRQEVAAMGVRTQPVPIENTNATFQRLDVNGDGFLSRAEAESTLAGIPGASFDATDRDRDGFLSFAEASAHLRWLEGRGASGAGSFDALDANRDGFLSRAEAEPLVRAHGGGYAAPAATYSFERLDANGDGFLSRQEAAAIANPPTFERYDTNRDGYLSRAEADSLVRFGVGGTGSAPAGTVYGPRY